MSNFPKIYGMNKSSEMGVNLFAPSIFLGKCNLRCPYCMNHKLINPLEMENISLEEVKAHVEENNCEWVNVSGGEPTCSGEEKLRNLFNEIKSWGCKVGMATNGIETEVIRGVVGLVNYVALDIKASGCDPYSSISPVKNRDSSFTHVLWSQALLAEEKIKREDFDYEIRTTLFPLFIDKKKLQEIGSIIRKQDKWVLQRFRNNIAMFDEACDEIEPYTEKEVEELLKVAKRITPHAVLRDV